MLKAKLKNKNGNVSGLNDCMLTTRKPILCSLPALFGNSKNIEL